MPSAAQAGHSLGGVRANEVPRASRDHSPTRHLKGREIRSAYGATVGSSGGSGSLRRTVPETATVSPASDAARIALIHDMGAA